MRPHRPEHAPVPWPPHEVTTVCEMFLEDIDRAAPGLVEGLYLHGSLGFGEWYAGRSDIDYVAVLAEPPGQAATAALREVHVGLTTTFPRPAFDGFHVTWLDLGRPPGQCADVPVTFAGDFGEQGRVDMNPVTWHELARHGAAVRGPAPERVDIWTDQAELRAYTHGNLRSYWAGQVEQVARFPAEAAKPEIAAWLVLGLPRLHHLLATDRLTSKDGAGHHAVAAFGERWRPLVTEALAHRATGARAGVLSEAELAAQVVEFAGLVLDAGLTLEP